MTDSTCKHSYVWSSPAGTDIGIGVCVYCRMPDPDELARLASALDAMSNAMSKCARAAEVFDGAINELVERDLQTASTRARTEHLRAKREGVNLALGYIAEEMRAVE